jgi:hypothetical protein
MVGGLRKANWWEGGMEKERDGGEGSEFKWGRKRGEGGTRGGRQKAKERKQVRS